MPFVNYSSEELADVHYIYGYCDGNALEAEREYGRRFPNRRRVTRQTFQFVHQRLRERGQFFPYRHEVAYNVNRGIFSLTE